MIYIHHRINTLNQLELLPINRGAEIDLRSDLHIKGKLILHHDPWQEGTDFETWLKLWTLKKQKGMLILNTKEDGLETQIMDMCHKYNIKNYLFLDTVFPTLKSWIFDHQKDHFFIRISKYESLESALIFKNQIKWAWIDCFDGIPLSINKIKEASQLFKLCLVSPELQKHPDALKNFLDVARYCQAICTKIPDQWILSGIEEQL